jgi:23S rRNA pseudouridine2604 synthase
MTRRTLDLPSSPGQAGKRKSSAARPVRISYAERSSRPAPTVSPADSARSSRAANAPAAAAPRAPRHDNPGDPRLSKRMGELGLCSRREADEWIVKGWVKVDGKVVDTLGVRVSPQARIEVDRAATAQQSELVTILLHKPVGYVSGQAEDGYEPAVVLIRPENRWAEDPSPLSFQPAHLRGLAPAGRLDIDSTGLLVFTQDGRVAKHLIGQDSSVEKEYLVRVEGTLADDGLRRLRHGLMLDGMPLKPAQVAWQNDDQLRFLLREGRKRQIRRMCELVGLVVTGLKRVRSGNVPLGRLPVGQWRYLRRDETF